MEEISLGAWEVDMFGPFGTVSEQRTIQNFVSEISISDWWIYSTMNGSEELWIKNWWISISDLSATFTQKAVSSRTLTRFQYVFILYVHIREDKFDCCVLCHGQQLDQSRGRCVPRRPRRPVIPGQNETIVVVQLYIFSLQRAAALHNVAYINGSTNWHFLRTKKNTHFALITTKVQLSIVSSWRNCEMNSSQHVCFAPPSMLGLLLSASPPVVDTSPILHPIFNRGVDVLGVHYGHHSCFN